MSEVGSTGKWTTRIAVAALAISLFSAIVGAIPNVILFFNPKVEMGIPDRIRLVQYQDENGTRIEAYVQPTVVNVGWNTQVEVIRGASLRAEPAKGAGPAMEFRWRNHGKFVTDPAGSASPPCVAEEYSGDTAPLVSSPNEVLAPAILLDPTTKPDNLYFEPKRYHMTLTLERTINDNPLVKPFEVDITEDHIEVMNDCKGRWMIKSTQVV